MADVKRAQDRRGSGQHHGDLRNALLDAAHDLVGERGVTGWTMADVTRRVGVSSAAPYKHFGDREELLAGLAARGLTRLRDRLDAASAPSSGGVGKVLALAREYLAFAADDRAHFESAFLVRRDKSHYADLVAASGEVFERFVFAVGPVAPPGAAPSLAYAVGAMVHGHAMLLTTRTGRVSGPGGGPDEVGLQAAVEALTAWTRWPGADTTADT